jgi:2-polyprenyl-6-methoxyphenol hydroxylase-like FAD-dependent oxidoreductase
VSAYGKQEIRARYVVGADGMHSIVRRSASIGFNGDSYEDSFVLADVEMDWSHGREDVKLFFSPKGLVVVAPLPAGTFRIVATLADAPERPDVTDIQALLDERGPRSGRTVVKKVTWSSRFRLHHRVADAYRAGRLFIVGDAAHVHSPAGGQGMNTGLVDAVTLGRVLVEVLSRARDESFLDMYEQRRRPAAIEVLGLAGRLTTMATLKAAPQRFVRNLALAVINALPVARRRLQHALSGISRRSAAELPGASPSTGTAGSSEVQT